MDPNACLLDWAYAVLAEDRMEANEHYSALRSWMERGGFEPDWGKADADGRGLPSRKQFFSYDPRTGRIGE